MSKDINLKSKKARRRMQNMTGYLFLVPWLLVLIIFTLYPFVEGMRMSLYKYSTNSQTFIGLDNFRELFKDTTFWNSVIITLKMCAIIIPGTIVVSLLIAYAIQDINATLKSVVKIVFYLCSIVSQVALIMVWKWMFSPTQGLYKSLCEIFGMVELNLLGDTTYSIPLISILVMSFTVAQPIVLFNTALEAVPSTLYEAAQLDGAGRFTRFLKVGVPSISDVLLLVLVTTTINNLQVFVVPYLLTGGGPGGQTTPILLHIYRSAFEYGQYGYASAMGVVLFCIIGFFVAIQFILQSRKEDDE